MKNFIQGIGLYGLSLILVALCGVLLLSNRCFADELSERPLSAEGPVSLPDHWKKVDPSSIVEVLEMLIGQTKANYERIRTWQGTYVVRLQQRLTQEYVARVFGSKLGPDRVCALMEHIDFTQRFAMDMASDSIYRAKETSRLKFIKEGSNQVVEIPGAGPVDERSLVAGEHYVHVRPKEVWGQISELPDHPTAQNMRVAFRELREQSAGQHFGDLMEPRFFFGSSSLQRSWEGLSLFLRVLKGEMGEAQKKALNAALTMYEADGPKGKWYRHDQELISPTGKIYASTIYSGSAGFNPVSLIVTDDAAGKRVRNEMQWRWQSFDGIYIPAWIRESISPEVGKLTGLRECKLVTCTVNQPLDPHQFDYQGLGLKNTDLVVDRIARVVYTMQDGEPKKLANFGEEYIPPSRPGETGRAARLRAVVGAVALLLVVAALLLRRRRRRAQAG